MPRYIACTNFKGGVGKTTIAINLAAALALLGRRVLLIDADTQGQSAHSLGVTPPADSGLSAYVTNNDPAAILNVRPNLDLLAGGTALAGLKMEIARKPYGGERTLSDALKPLSSQYDYFIFDTGPGYDSLSIAVLFASREVLAPVGLEPLAIAGLVTFVEQLKAMQEHHEGLALRYVVPNAQDRRVAQTAEILEQIRAHFGELVTEPIRYNIRLSEAAGHGEHILEYAPDSNGSADIATLTQRIIDDE